MAQVKYSNDLAVLINTEGAIDKKGSNITWEDVCHEAEEYVTYNKNHPKYKNNNAISYFASEIQLHANGCLPNNDFLPNENDVERWVFDAMPKHGTGSYDMAMKNGDLAKSFNKGCHVEDKKFSICQGSIIEDRIMSMFFINQAIYTGERIK